MKKLLAILILLLINNSFAQKKTSGEIVYKKSIVFKSPKQESISYNEQIKSIFNSLNKMKYVLKFNNTNSYFGLQKSMELDIEKINRKALYKGKGNVNFYSDLNLNTCVEIKKHGGETFLITNSKPKFKLVNETKIIGGYTCYKATTTETVYFSKFNIGIEDKVNQITAWYTNQIPSQFGPLNFFGLPGLILELQFSNVTYSAIELKLSNKPIKISKPAKGKKMKFEEYEKLMVETAKKMNIQSN